MTPDELKSIRTTSLGLTQQGLADRLFMTREHIARMEKGVKKITGRTAAQIRALVPKAAE